MGYAPLSEMLASISGAALLTNASALLLGGASTRYALARDAVREAHRENPVPVSASAATRRLALSAAAVHSFHVALVAFGLACALLFLAASHGLDSSRWSPVLNTLGSLLTSIGFVGLVAGVGLLGTEGVFGVTTSGIRESHSYFMQPPHNPSVKLGEPND